MALNNLSNLNKSAELWPDHCLDQPHQQADKARRVRLMFDAVTGRYDLFNTVASMGIDRYWRARLIRRARPLAGKKVLDLCCGPGTLTVEQIKRNDRPELLVGLDFSLPMLNLAQKRLRGRGPNVTLCCADALNLPFGDQTFDLVTCTFGIRNFQDLPAGLKQLHAVLKPSGKLLILEFALPTNRYFAMVYRMYLRYILPVVGTVIAGDRVRAYQYLHNSVAGFDQPPQLCRVFRDTGFEVQAALPLTAGVVWLYQLQPV